MSNDVSGSSLLFLAASFLLLTVVCFSVQPPATPTLTLTNIDDSAVIVDKISSVKMENINVTMTNIGIIGDDYLGFQGNTGTVPNGVPASVWTAPKLEKYATYTVDYASLLFKFTDTSGGTSSYYDETKMDDVLDLFDGVGVQCILSTGDGDTFFGTSDLIDDWVVLANLYKNDSRVYGFMLFQEVGDAHLNAAMTDTDAVHIYLADMIDAIRATGFTKPLIYPFFGMMSSIYDYGFPCDWSAFYDDLVTYGITGKTNIIYDVMHPYFWEYPAWDNGLTDPVARADELTAEIVDAASYLTNVVIGETFPHSSSETSPSGNHFVGATQNAFISQLINNCVTYNTPFNLWCWFTRQSSYSYTGYEESVEASNYPLLNSEPPQTFNFGNENVEPDAGQNDNGYVNISRYQAPYDGFITSLQLYCNKSLGTPHVKAVVYSDTASAPDALLGEGDSIAITSGDFGWVQLTGLNVPIVAGTYYWLGNYCGDEAGDQIGEKWAAAGANFGWNDVPTTWTYPICEDPFGDSTLGSPPISMYAECVASTGGVTVPIAASFMMLMNRSR